MSFKTRKIVVYTLVCSILFSVISSIIILNVNAAPSVPVGYILTYHNNGEYTKYGDKQSLIDEGCDNCVEVLSESTDCTHYLIANLIEIHWKYDKAGKRYVECTDGSRWYIGDYKVYCMDPYGTYGTYRVSEQEPTDAKVWGNARLDLRLYTLIASNKNCTDPEVDGRYVKGLAHYRWLYRDGESFINNDLLHPDIRGSAYKDDRSFYKMFAGYNILQQNETKNGRGEYPTFDIAINNKKSRGCQSGLGQLMYTGDNIKIVEDAIGGFEWKTHTHKIYKYRCTGHLKPIEYTIKYDLNGGIGTIKDTKTQYDKDETVKSIGSTTKKGYRFVGWGLNDRDKVTHNTGDTVRNLTTVNNDTVTFYAIWEPITYTVNIHQNAPTDYIRHNHQVSVPSSVQNKYKNQSLENSLGGNWTYSNGVWSKKFVYNSTILNNTTEFFTLTGWHTDNNYMWTTRGTNGTASGTAYPSDQTNRWNLTKTNQAVIDLYPKWEKNTYYIDYNNNNEQTTNIYGDTITTKATGTVSSTTCKYDTDVTLATNGFTRTGYIFKEWNTKSDGTGTRYSSGQHLTKPDLTATNNARITLYAIWEPITYTVNLHQNKPLDATHDIANCASNAWTLKTSGDKYYTRVFRYDHDTLDTSNKVFTLIGWKHTNNTWWSAGGTNGETSGKTYTAGSMNLTTTNKDVLNLYPNWIKHTYYIDYSGNNTEKNIYGDKVTTSFSGTVATTTCRYDTDVTLRANSFTKPGYQFKEWNTKSDGTGTRYKSGESLKKPNFTATDNGRVTLYAIWEPIVYNITFHPESGTIINWDNTYPKYKVSVRFDSIKEIRLPDVEQFAHDFDGWAKDRQFAIKNDGTYPKLDIDNFFEKGNYKISVSGNKSIKAEAQIHFNPFNEQLDLWAWFNRKPVFVDIYEGLFFEGQGITYKDTLELVRSWDYEDDYVKIMKESIKKFFEDKITKIDQDIQTDEDNRKYLIAERDNLIYNRDKTIGETDITKLDAQIDELANKIQDLFIQKEKYEQELETQIQALPERAQLLKMQVAEIKYLTPNVTFNYRTDKLSSNGINVAAGDGEQFKGKKLDYKKMFIKTGSRFIGDFDITYQVHDKGVGYTNESGNTEYIPNTDITMEYTRRCKVNYNYNPSIYTQGEITYGSEELSAHKIKEIQGVFDSEDTEDNIPWWSKGNTLNSATGTSLVLHPDKDTETLQKLQDNLIITGISDIRFSSAFIYEHADIAEHFKNDFISPESSTSTVGVYKGEYYVRGQGIQPIYDKSTLLDTIYGFKDNNEDYHGIPKSEVYKAITSIDITFDSVDQWGKWASGRVSKEVYERMDTGDNTPGSINPDNKPDGLTPSNNGGYEWPDVTDGEPWDEIVTQDEEERTTTIIIINDDTDSWLVDQAIIAGHVKDNVRYIDKYWLEKEHLDKTYWGDYGRKVLQEILDKNSKNTEDIKEQHTGEYKNTINKKINMTIKDYTE